LRRLPRARQAVVLAGLLLGAPALAYLPPATAILKRVVQKRDELGVTSLEADGTLELSGDGALALKALLAGPGGPPPTPTAPPAGTGGAPTPQLSVPAALFVKAPGRCRLELAPEGAPPAARPTLSLRGARMAGQRGLDGVLPARALLEGLCALLAERGAGGAEPERYLAERLAGRGVALGEVAFGRLGERVAWVLGARPQDPRPQAWIDKLTFQPIRLLASLGGADRDVRLLDFGSPIGGEIFPRAVEVWSADKLEARFTLGKVTTNLKLPDALF